jgi:microcystin-dependent protein
MNLFGEVCLFAGEHLPDGWLPCDGSPYDEDNWELSCLLGHRFASSEFVKPELPRLSPVLGQGGKPIKYLLRVSGFSSYTSGSLGEIRLYAGAGDAPRGWIYLSENEYSLPIWQYTGLHSVIGDSFGGDMTRVFSLPKIPPLLESDGGLSPIRYMICVEGGTYPPFRDPSSSEIGFIKLTAAERDRHIWDGWTLCNGDLLSASEHNALYSIIRNTWGGDSTSFAVPNLTPVIEPPTDQYGEAKNGVRYLICTSGLYP